MLDDLGTQRQVRLWALKEFHLRRREKLRPGQQWPELWTASVQILALLLASCVALSPLCNLFVPWFLHL